jgi:hypothetical protein
MNPNDLLECAKADVAGAEPAPDDGTKCPYCVCANMDPAVLASQGECYMCTLWRRTDYREKWKNRKPMEGITGIHQTKKYYSARCPFLDMTRLVDPEGKVLTRPCPSCEGKFANQVLHRCLNVEFGGILVTAVDCARCPYGGGV